MKRDELERDNISEWLIIRLVFLFAVHRTSSQAEEMHSSILLLWLESCHLALKSK